jgi:pyruvate, water dikinase
MYKHIKFFKDITLSDIPQVGGKTPLLVRWSSILDQRALISPTVLPPLLQAIITSSKRLGSTKKLPRCSRVWTRKTSAISKSAVIKSGPSSSRPNSQRFRRRIVLGYRELSKVCGHPNLVVAVRSSATAEDLPNASFAGQQENIFEYQGEKDVLTATKSCIASLFTARAIAYRIENKFAHMKVALSVGIQQMVAVRSKAAGVMFTIDTESGFSNAVIVTSIYGLGENIVQGRVSPDEFTVFKPTLAILKRKVGAKKMMMIPVAGSKTKNVAVAKEAQGTFSITDKQVKILARWGMDIEEHYKHPMDIEWALDADDNKLYIVQARGETVQSRRNNDVVEEYKLLGHGKLLTKGASVGNKIGVGNASKIMSLKDIGSFKPGDVLVTEMTDPDWVPVMQQASAIVTDKGGRTCHAAIVSRELGIPCVVGTGNGTTKIEDKAPITVSCAEGDDGYVYAKQLKFEVNRTNVKNLKRPKTKIMMNIGSPDHAFAYSMIPNDGVGLAREEFIIDSHIKVHPLALLHFDRVQDKKTRAIIEELTKGYSNKSQYFVDKLTEGISIIGAAFHPKDVIIRFSDFKTNEYAGLIGGKQFEPAENNPMIGWRGASRYYSEAYRPAFELECKLSRRPEMRWVLPTSRP